MRTPAVQRLLAEERAQGGPAPAFWVRSRVGGQIVNWSIDELQAAVSQGVDGPLDVYVPAYDGTNVRGRWVDLQTLAAV